MSLSQFLSLVGAFLLLLPYVAFQLRRMNPRSLLYNLLNLAGAGVLFAVGLATQLWGFVVLNGIWAGASIWAVRRHTPLGRVRRETALERARS